ncbi:MAG: chromosome segregation protein SMC [Chloroflexi bacterium RBG_16_47_49]|nr:MAG: chromosome segregation protein SMC [Chloroflexi bacterium RBG_16_47_49]
MPARLKSFELHGYKTFASRNEFQFSDGITAIVGPNGSGKSNIADALRWVLGEQSYGLLRGKKTEDMIFSGSENRPRAGMASATIVFDNSDGWLPIDFVEVGITRRAYRDGENEYLLNGQRVRLKDVSEVLAKSGLAERTYTIIGQGLVDAALALKAEERRRLFEEAAGIGLHRSRREEAIKRLETTRRNLERVHDILAELQPRLRSLERQAKRAQEYNQMKTDLKVVLREWYGYHWHKSQAEFVEAQIFAKGQEEDLSQIQSNQHDLDQKLSEYRSQINELRGKLNDWHKELTTLHQRREMISREQAVNSERSRLLLLQLEQLSKERIKMEEEVGIQKDQLGISNQEFAQLELDLIDTHLSVTESLEKLNTRQKERSIIEVRIQSVQQDIARLTTRSSQQQALMSEKESHVNRLKQALQKIDRDIISAESNLSSAQNRLNSFIAEKEEKAKHAEGTKAELQVIQDKLASFEIERRAWNEKISTQKTNLAQLQAEMNVLEEAEKSLTGYEEGARILIQAMNDQQIEGAIGTLGNRLSVPEEYETAIAAVMGEYIDSLIVKSINQTDKALDLIGNETTRGSLFPLDAISHTRPISLDLGKAPVEPGNILGVAAQFVKAEAQLTPIIEWLFGHVIIVRDRKTARTILASRDWRDIPNLRIVTLEGEVYLSSGPIITGASGKGLLARPRQQREMKSIQEQETSKLDDLENKYHTLEVKISELLESEKDCNEKLKNALEVEKSITSKVSKQELQVEKIQHDLKWHQDQKISYQADLDNELTELTNIRSEVVKLQEESQELRRGLDFQSEALDALSLEELQMQHTYWNTNAAVIEQALTDARNRQQEKITRLQQVENNLTAIISRSSQLDLDIKTLSENMGVCSEEEAQIAVKIEGLGKIVDPHEEKLSTLERDHTGLLSTDTEARQILRAAEQRYTQAKINLAHHQEAFESLRRHIEDDFGLVLFDYTDSISGPKPLPLDGMVEELPKVEELSSEIEDTIRQQKAQIRRMGAINPEAQIEYQEVKERFEFLSTQVDDLIKAEGDIKEVIAELDILMEREFRKTFEAVAQEFRQIFTRLFGGGSARLALTDPDDMTVTGIDIEARLPGRREQGLSLLSGGERSLTAAALIFSLLRVSPTPFCILDEVDAMLDEANVGRFRDLLTELSEKTQFIVITHNRNTIQAASIIYGVTMGRDSASQVISLKMDELGEEFGV